MWKKTVGVVLSLIVVIAVLAGCVGKYNLDPENVAKSVGTDASAIVNDPDFTVSDASSTNDSKLYSKDVQFLDMDGKLSYTVNDGKIIQISYLASMFKLNASNIESSIDLFMEVANQLTSQRGKPTIIHADLDPNDNDYSGWIDGIDKPLSKSEILDEYHQHGDFPYVIEWDKVNLRLALMTDKEATGICFISVEHQ